MFVLRSMRKHPEILADVSVNHSRTGAVKLLITRRDEQSSKLLRGTVRRTTACPGGRNWAAIQPPLQKDDSTLRLATLLSSCLRGPMPAHAVGTWTPGPSRRGPAQAFSSIAAMYPVLASATARPLAVRSRLGPNVDASLAGFKK